MFEVLAIENSMCFCYLRNSRRLRNMSLLMHSHSGPGDAQINDAKKTVASQTLHVRVQMAT